MPFCDRLHMLLQNRELSQLKFAEEINISASAVGNYTRGLRQPDYETLKKIAEYFDVTTDFLLDAKIRNTNDDKENELLQIYRALDSEKKSFLLAQARFMLSQSKNSK